MIFRNKKNIHTHYRFKSLNTYISREWLAEEKKKYRTVFDVSEMTYLYVELAFYNKLFEKKEWEVGITLKCFKLKNETEKEQICVIHTQFHVNPEDAVAYLREGWGHKDLGFWKRGDYVWEVYFEEQFIEKKYFYVENGGQVTPHKNPYFDIQNVRLYEGANNGTVKKSRKYYTQFKREETRYIWTEFNIKNLQLDSWYCELFFYFYNETGQLKGETVELKRIEVSDREVEVVTGWGSDITGSWYLNKCRIEVVFMDTLIAIIPFEVGKEFMEGTPTLLKEWQSQNYCFTLN